MTTRLHRLRCFTSPRYFVPLPAGHVFPMSKFPDSARQLVEDGTLHPDDLADPGLADERDLLRVHTPAYLHAIRSGTFDAITARKLGLPPSEALSLRSHCAVAGTLAAARAALKDGIACNLAGGTHHAFPDRGEGFCVFNDVAVATREADEPYLQVMIVDLDAHQGNGTNFILAGDANIYTFDVHVGRNYPSRKEPAVEDVPLPRWVKADQYVERLHTLLPRAAERFEPDLAFYIAGADVHADDRFGQMMLSTADMAERDRFVIDTLRDWNIPLTVLYGGGYNKAAGMTAALHCQTVRLAAERSRQERASGA